MKNFLVKDNILIKKLALEKKLIFSGYRLRDTIKSYNQKRDFLIINKTYNKQNFFEKSRNFEKSFDQVLDILSSALNKFHNINNDKKYWKILISAWLFNFLQHTLDKWYCLNHV